MQSLIRPFVKSMVNGMTGPGAGASLRAQVIAALFGSSEQGALYDPSDLTTLFQDSAGTKEVKDVIK